MTIRQIQESDIPKLTILANRGLDFDQFDEALLREKTIGAKGNDSELGLVCEADGRVVAFAQGVVGGYLDGKTKGTVRLFCVDRAYRRKGYGTELIAELETRLKDRGAQVCTMMDSPANYLTPGIDFRYTEAYCFLLNRGFSVFRENHNLLCDLDINAWPNLDADVERLQGDDLEVRRAAASDEAAVVEFLSKEWAGWIPEVANAIENDPPGLFIALKDGKVVAFAAYQGNNKSLPFFGPMGTSEVLRGRGAGSVLLRLCLRELARQGWNHAIIPWVGPVGFYARYCGARIDRCFWAYRKDL